MAEEPKTSSDPTTYNGKCHCGSYEYTLTVPQPLDSAPKLITKCNCSICSTNGYLLVYPTLDDLKFKKGSFETLSKHQFASKFVKHMFCPTCGSSLFILPSKDWNGVMPASTIVVNVRMFQDFDYENLDYRLVDRKNFVPEPPTQRVE